MTLLTETIQAITPQDQAWRDKAKNRLDQLTMPHWALGRLMDLALDLAGMTRSLNPPVSRRAVVVMAGDHGVVTEGISKFPQEVTPQMVGNFVNGGAGINALASQAGARVVVVDMGVVGDLSALVRGGRILDRKIAPGTANLAAGPAMSLDQAVAALEAGIGVANDLAGEIDLFGTGDMGIGNTTPSAAIVASVTGGSVESVTGRGTGLDDGQLDHKIRVIKKGLSVNRPDSGDGLDVLAKVGGFEIGG
ncbi:MAG TPA: nicotinate-nucleotide--dimethylbenzimidazole phosphoribosyltransferase, partial [Desulfurivibrionaceae bacterium]|nr:nicotinate-nucleotide--dimethylbenzimidazole phosphoribosyltransferase [Desulfurivibrionaceae bacterium]